MILRLIIVVDDLTIRTKVKGWSSYTSSSKITIIINICIKRIHGSCLSIIANIIGKIAN